MSKFNEEWLEKQSFVDFLQYMHDAIERISHRKKSDNAYYEAREAARIVIARFMKEHKVSWDSLHEHFEGNDLRLSQNKLDRYEFRDSDKRKEDVINEFVKEFTYDVNRMIASRRRGEESSEKKESSQDEN
jgi:hypothetical protein